MLVQGARDDGALFAASREDTGRSWIQIEHVTPFLKPSFSLLRGS